MSEMLNSAAVIQSRTDSCSLGQTEIRELEVVRLANGRKKRPATKAH
jgi:hypothetical protein